ncbi:hypothetical protein DFP81_1293 [Marinomonas pollencensis]|uniref:Uncharacterized protein n=1 Tax=Marinomonas pollencensis TaxID=491954 RepID=A0A3E0D6F5_9GAMM|nr:hypothetical protein DFP81_1293 [Marinomonas pollencensis]
MIDEQFTLPFMELVHSSVTFNGQRVIDGDTHQSQTNNLLDIRL